MLITSSNFRFEIVIATGVQCLNAKNYWDRRGGLWLIIDADGIILWDEKAL